MICGIRRSLVVQSPGVESPPSGVKAWLLTVASRFHRPHSTEDKNPLTNGEVTLNSHDYPKRFTHLYRGGKSVKGEKEKKSQKRREQSNQ